MLQGITRTANISECGRYRWSLTRAWDARPPLLACMFNPSTADALVDDPTITLLCHIAAHNGFGSLVVVNGIPLRSSTPEPALALLDADARGEAGATAVLEQNASHIHGHVGRAGAVLYAWGALAAKTPNSARWFSALAKCIEAALPLGGELYCLGRTQGGPRWPPQTAPLMAGQTAPGRTTGL